MTLTILIVAAAAVGLTALYAVATRSAEPALATERTAVALADPAAETLVGRDPVPGLSRTDWQLATVSNLTDAEDLLDCLENQGFAERELVVMGNSTFAVRWR